ncbi:MAG TPA: DUF3574 domain-containing protein [Blastocatellia bacterium]|nr:DUF3574 domain-containing protein [Blastocatellia bacterium]HMV82008.1 DUF3574 domain-containing protein [Blastocatellia bacterium]HMX28707.1 DUF3574 domain-containing protein [Blastocatellia bacterium]HMY72125.1 DUF3574 domain-containing protein [Blastocatellia bacterium]HMZ18216.1 DUF3574 domain-containing protein [Blastocatellia bacterium]
MKQYLLNKALPLIFLCALLCVAPSLISNPWRLSSSGESLAQRLPSGLWNRTELYFGSSKPDGTMVTEQQFKQFLDQEVTPRFPDGLTVLTGFGQFRNSANVIIQERSTELILLYPLQMQDSNRKIQEIREAYKRLFQQESVLRVDSLATVSF